MRDGACQWRSGGGNDCDDEQLCFGKRVTLERWIWPQMRVARIRTKDGEHSDANEATNKLEPIFTNNNPVLPVILRVCPGFGRQTSAGCRNFLSCQQLVAERSKHRFVIQCVYLHETLQYFDA
jgi:hypothetical protein